MEIPLTYKIPKVLQPLDYSALANDKQWPTIEFTVTEADVRRWADLFEDQNPWYFGSSPFGFPVAPTSIFYYPGQSAFAPLRDFAGVLASLGFDALGPVAVGARLSATTRIVDRWQRRGRAFVAYELDVREGARSVSRTRRCWAFAAPTDSGLPERAAEPPPAEEPSLGEIVPVSLDLSVERLSDFEGPGERNGHTDVEMARAHGNPGPLAQGALSFGLVTRMLQSHFGKGFFEAGSLDLRLTKPVYAPGQITAAGSLVANRDGRSQCRVWVRNSRGETTAVGSASSPNQ